MAEEKQQTQEAQTGMRAPDRMTVKSEYLSIKDKTVLRELTIIGTELYTFIVWTRVSTGLSKAARKKEGIAIMRNFTEYANQLIEVSKQDIGKIHAALLSLKYQMRSMKKDHVLYDLYTYMIERMCVICPGMIVVDAKTKKLDTIVEDIDKDAKRKRSQADVPSSDSKCHNMNALKVATTEQKVGMCAPYVWAIPPKEVMEKFNTEVFTNAYRLACKYAVLAYFLLDTINRLREVKDGDISKSLATIYRRFSLIFFPLVRENLIRLTPEARALYLEAAYHINLLHSWDDNRSTKDLKRELDIQIDTSAHRRYMHKQLLSDHLSILPEIKYKKEIKELRHAMHAELIDTTTTRRTELSGDE